MASSVREGGYRGSEGWKESCNGIDRSEKA